MNQKLIQVLEYEKQVYKVFSEFKSIGGYDVFVTPELREEPHWNLVYPKGVQDFKALENAEIQDYFKAKKVVGHLGVLGEVNRPVKECCVYYSCQSNQVGDLAAGIEVGDFDSINEFSENVATVFGYNNQTKEYFQKQMQRINSEFKCRFFSFIKEGQICGTASFFEVAEGVQFLFNFGILPELCGQGLAEPCLQALLGLNCGEILSYSESQAMWKLFPKVGFKALGTMSLIEF